MMRFLPLVALALLAAPAPAKPPNVLLILVDDMGFSDAGCYGGEIATPNLDKLAASGLRFTQFYNTARCWPSRAALMTGYYAQQVRRDALPDEPKGKGRGGSQGTRPAWAPLLPTRLRAAGYRSYHSGKWHIDGRPLDNGFDRSLQLEDHNSYHHPRNILVDGSKLPADDPRSNRYVTITTADHAIECLQSHAEQFADRPFFQYVAFTAPHFPLHALPEDIARYRTRYELGWDALRQARYERMRSLGLVDTPLSAPETTIGPPYDFPEAMKKLGAGEINRPLAWNELTEVQRRFQAGKMAVHAAMVDRMDREIGRILVQVERMQATENTLIVFASDNGASAEIMVRGGGHDPQAPAGSDETYLCLGPGWSTCANTPFRRHKTWVHEGGIATPFIVHWPAGISGRGELRTAPGHLVDVVPTVLELAGLPLPTADKTPNLAGISLVPAFGHDVELKRNSLWWLHEGNRALRQGDWKIVAAKGEPWQLFNLAEDRAETTDLADRHPDRLREMKQGWDARTDEIRRNATQEERSE